jgi:hypothetical protein
MPQLKGLKLDSVALQDEAPTFLQKVANRLPNDVASYPGGTGPQLCHCKNLNTHKRGCIYWDLSARAIHCVTECQLVLIYCLLLGCTHLWEPWPFNCERPFSPLHCLLIPSLKPSSPADPSPHLPLIPIFPFSFLPVYSQILSWLSFLDPFLLHVQSIPIFLYNIRYSV